MWPKEVDMIEVFDEIDAENAERAAAKTPEQLDLETKFKEIVERVMPQIEAKLAESRRILNEACALSNEHGIPFRGSVPSQAYVPDSFHTLFAGIDRDLVSDLTEVWGLHDHNGWMQSQICW